MLGRGRLGLRDLALPCAHREDKRHQKRLAVFYPDRLGTITTRIATGRNVIVVRSPAQVRAVAGPVRGSERRGKAGAGAILGGMG